VELAKKGAYPGNCLSDQRTARPRPARVSDDSASPPLLTRAIVENCCEDIREFSGAWDEPVHQICKLRCRLDSPINRFFGVNSLVDDSLITRTHCIGSFAVWRGVEYGLVHAVSSCAGGVRRQFENCGYRRQYSKSAYAPLCRRSTLI